MSKSQGVSRKARAGMVGAAWREEEVCNRAAGTYATVIRDPGRKAIESEQPAHGDASPGERGKNELLGKVRGDRFWGTDCEIPENQSGASVRVRVIKVTSTFC